MNFEFPDCDLVSTFGECTIFENGEITKKIMAVRDQAIAEEIPGYESRTSERITTLTFMTDVIPCPKKGDKFTTCDGMVWIFDRTIESDGYITTAVVTP